MSRSTTAALLSALVLPGAGHLYLRRFARGMVLVGISLVCLWLLLDGVLQQASVVVGRLEAEGGLIDGARLSELVAQSAAGTGGSLPILVLAGCWLFGIVDAWRLGRPGQTPQGPNR